MTRLWLDILLGFFPFAASLGIAGAVAVFQRRRARRRDGRDARARLDGRAPLERMLDLQAQRARNVARGAPPPTPIPGRRLPLELSELADVVKLRVDMARPSTFSVWCCNIQHEGVREPKCPKCGRWSSRWKAPLADNPGGAVPGLR